MILSNVEIRRAIQQGVISIDPEPLPFQYSSTSLDLRLGDRFLYWDIQKMDSLSSAGIDYSLDPSRLNSFQDLAREFLVPAPVDTEGCRIIHPGDFVLGITYERVGLPQESGIAARVEGRSSLARMGLVVHLTAPTIHARWDGKITLEMVNLGNWPPSCAPTSLWFVSFFERVGELPESQTPTQFQGQTSPGGV